MTKFVSVLQRLRILFRKPYAGGSIIPGFIVKISEISFGTTFQSESLLE